jgi:hypothetical protein
MIHCVNFLICNGYGKRKNSLSSPVAALWEVVIVILFGQ